MDSASPIAPGNTGHVLGLAYLPGSNEAPAIGCEQIEANWEGRHAVERGLHLHRPR